MRRTTTRARRGGSMQLLRGLGAAMLTTIIVVAVFALLMQWVKPTEDTVRIFNQLLKVVSVAIGTYIAVGRGQEGGLLRGSLIGLLYLALGYLALAAAALIVLGALSIAGIFWPEGAMLRTFPKTNRR